MTIDLAGRLHADMVAAMKAREKDRLSVLRMLVSALQESTLAKRSDLTADEMLRVVMGYAKKREEALAEARKAGREDLAAREEQELAIVRGYLPAQLSDPELVELVDAVVRELGATSMKDMGRVMKVCVDRVAGRADGSRVSPVVKSRLSG